MSFSSLANMRFAENYFFHFINKDSVLTFQFINKSIFPKISLKRISQILL